MKERHQLFIKEYVVDFNATQAAIRAGYSEKTAGSQAHDLLKKPEIQAAIQLEIEARAERLNLTQDFVLRGLLQNLEGARLSEDWAPANKALELIGKHLGMFSDKVVHAGDPNAPLLGPLEVIFKRADDKP